MLRIASSPSYANIVDSQTKSQIHFSPLQILTDRYERLFKSPISNIEQIAPFTAPSWWIPLPITIFSNKKEAEKAQKHMVNDVRRKKHCLLIYTDGSGINGKIGAAAVGPTCNQNAFLGSPYSFTVYSGEL